MINKPNKPDFSLLQIYRGIAAVLVVWVHSSAIGYHQFDNAFWYNCFKWGNAGVDFFFVLSGFLILYIHYEDVEKPQKLKTYFFKRWGRIYPFYWLITSLILPVYFLIPSFGLGNERNPIVILNSYLLLPLDRPPLLNVGWSLRHEVFFYAIFGCLILFKKKYVLPLVFLWAFSVVTIMAFNIGSPVNFDNSVLTLIFWPQNIEFLMGCLIGYSLRKWDFSIISSKMSLICICIFITAFLGFGQLPNNFLDFKHPEHIMTFGLASAFILFFSVCYESSGGVSARVKQHLIYRTMLYVGNASYSIYLVHGPVLSILFKVASKAGIISKLGVISVTAIITLFTVLITCLAHSYVEIPLLNMVKKRLALKPQKTI